jgi:hypothetical protein
MRVMPAQKSSERGDNFGASPDFFEMIANYVEA